MPYKQIHWIKLEKRLLNDYRFFTMSENAQLTYIKLLLLAAETNNKIPKSERILTHTLRSKREPNEITKDLKEIRSYYPKLIETKDFYFFRGFKERHNWVTPRSSQGVPMELVDKIKKEDIDKIRIYYINKKKWKEEDLHSDDYGRIHKAGKTLFFKARKNMELLKACIEWVSNRGYCDWTLETCIKKWPDFLKYIEVVQAKDNQGKEAQERFQKMKEEAVKEGLIPKEKLDTLIKQAFDKR